MTALAKKPVQQVRIHPLHQLSLGYHFLALTFTTSSLLMGAIVSQEALFIGLIGLFFVGVTQLMSALIGGLQYGRKWQIVHLLAALGLLSVQAGIVSIIGWLGIEPFSSEFVIGWLVANLVIGLVAGWSYWYNLRASYVAEAASLAAGAEPGDPSLV
jgi:hypothetical protein